MAMTHHSSVRFWIVGAALTFALLGVVYAITPPFFIQAGQHYLGGPNLARIDGIYRCDPYGSKDCAVTKESLVVAIGNDPDMSNWWPVRAEFITFE